MSEHDKLAAMIKKYRHYPNFLGIDIVQVNQPGSIDDTMLHIASWNGEAQDVATLLSIGADANAIGDIGNTALHCAATKGHLEIVQLLLEHGADPTIKNEFGETAADWARNSNHAAVARLLKTHRPN